MGYLSHEQHALVTQAVAAAEEHTAGEIVTVLAERSDGYSDVALWWAAVAAFSAMAVFTAFPDCFLGLIDRLHGGWGLSWSRGELLTVVTGIGLAKFLGVWLIQQWEPLKFWLVPSPVKTLRVHDRAIAHFKVGAERRTHGRTGVLIYISMREHRAEIVADEAIAKLVTAEVWGEAMADMLAEIRKGNIAEGLVAGIRDVGKVLAQHFPRHENDINELPDRLIEV